MQAERLLQMIYLLLEGEDVTAAELARRLEVSERTIHRDVERLSAAGIPVYSLQGRGGGIRLMPGFTLDRSLFSEEQQREILSALQGLRAVGAAEGDTLDRLSALFRRAPEDWIDVDFSPWGSDDREREKFQTLRRGILERRVTRFGYHSSYGRGGPRTTCPVKLSFKGGSWYLQGWHPEKGAYRTYKVQRMTGAVLTEEHFPPPPGPPPVLDGPGEAPGPPMVELELCFAPQAAYRLYDNFDPRYLSPQEDGGIRMTVAYPEDDWVYGFLLSFGDQVEVLSPPGVREELLRRAGAILVRYEKT